MVSKSNYILPYGKIILFSALFFISGCSMGLKGEFDCPGMPGVQCKNINEVNTLVTNGEFPKKSVITQVSIPLTVTKRTKTEIRMPVLSNEKVLTVLIDPYEDENGLLHQPGKVIGYAKLSRWETI